MLEIATRFSQPIHWPCSVWLKVHLASFPELLSLNARVPLGIEQKRKARMKIGFFGKQNSFAQEMLRRLKSENTGDEFLTWQSGDEAPSTKLDVIIAFGKVDSKEIEAQTKLGLLQMASAGYEGVDVDAATKAGVWVGSAPTTKTGNGESVAEFAVLLMLAASRRLNEELAFTHGREQSRPDKWEENR